jgi:apolipoprotein N-acyltransferase
MSALIVAVTNASTRKRAFVCGLLSGTFLYGSLFTAVGVSLLPFEWYGIPDPYMEGVLLVFSVVVASLVMGLSAGLFGSLVHSLKAQRWYDILLIPSAWVLTEVFGAYLYYLYTLGPGSFLGPHFTLGYIGYVLAEDPVFLQLAWFGGVYVLSFAVVFISVASAFAVRLKRKTYTCLLIAIAAVWTCCFVFLSSASRDTAYDIGTNRALSVAVISRYMEPAPEQNAEFREARFRELLDLLTPLRDLDAVVFPENAAFTRTLRESAREEEREVVAQTGREKQPPVLIDSYDSLQDGIYTSYVSLPNEVSKELGEKQFLLAFGEYIPYFYQFILRYISGENSLQTALKARNYVPGRESPLGLINGVLVAVRFCDEVMSPFLYRDQVRHGAGMLINISSLSWFHGSPFVYEHMQRIAKVRAVESGRWLIQSGNMAPAFVINERGRLIAETPWNETLALEITVPQKTLSTPYVAMGMFFVLGCVFLLAWRLGRLIYLSSFKESGIVHK